MYCPNCGQQQVSDEMRFCSRCGLALSALAEWLAGSPLPVMRTDETPVDTSPRRKGMRRAGKLMFVSAALLPVFFVFSLVIDEGAPMVFPVLLFFVAIVWMLYARLFSDKTGPAVYQPAQQSAFAATRARSSLPPANTTAIPNADPRQRVRTNELAQPPSVTEHTTRMLDNE